LPFIDNEVEAGFHKNPFANDPAEKPGEQKKIMIDTSQKKSIGK